MDASESARERGDPVDVVMRVNVQRSSDAVHPAMRTSGVERDAEFSSESLVRVSEESMTLPDDAYNREYL